MEQDQQYESCQVAEQEHQKILTSVKFTTQSSHLWKNPTFELPVFSCEKAHCKRTAATSCSEVRRQKAAVGSFFVSEI